MKSLPQHETLEYEPPTVDLSETRDWIEIAVFNPSPSELAARLYGASWREAVAGPSQVDHSYRTRRDPLPAFLARFLTDILAGIVGHDRRSTREARTDGWWVRDTSGRWRPIDVDELALQLSEQIEIVAAQAREARDDLEWEWRASPNDHDALRGLTPNGARLFRELDEAELRCALISGVSHAIAKAGRTFRSTLGMLRTRLALSDHVLDSIARDWLRKQLANGTIMPTTNGRITVASVRAAHDATLARGDFLPQETLYAALDRVLGPRIRRIEWSLEPLVGDVANRQADTRVAYDLHR